MPGWRLPGWHALLLFWGVLALCMGTLAAVLQALGPLPRPVASRAVDPSPGSLVASVTPVLPRVAPPDPALLERSPGVPSAQLPRVGPDGRAARTVYAAPRVAVPAGDSRIAVLVSGIGLSEKDTEAAIDGLPGPVSLAVSAYATVPPSTIEAARAAGHELFASIPMEPQGFPLNDEGTQSLLTGATPARNRLNLEWALGRVEGAVGATGASDGMRGERFADTGGAIDPVLDEIGGRGLLYIDPRPGHALARPGLYGRSVDAVIDDPPARAEIEAKLAALERIAREKGSAVGLVGTPQPVTLDRVAAWSRTLAARGFVLVPVSSLVPAPGEATASQ